MSPPASELRVRRIVEPEDLARAFAIREAVFVLEQQVPLEEERDLDDSRAVHVLALLGEDAVGTGRLVQKDEGRGKIGRIAVLGRARGSGIGRALMEALHAEGRILGLGEVFLDAQVPVIPFYERLGYVAEGERFLDAGIWHRRMRRRLFQ